MTEPAPAQRKKELLRQALKDLPGVVAGYGIGYGVGRTALETLLESSSSAPALRRILPQLAGAGMAYAGMRASRAFLRQDEGKKS